MTSSIITKKRIAKAFKSVLKNKDFEKVSVTDIMEVAQMRRQTFYSHFLDKYELLEWIFRTELQEQIIDNLNYISGIGLLHEIFYFFDQNRTFYKALFAVQTQNDFLSYFQDYCLQLVVKIVAEHSQEHSIHLPQAEKNFFFHYHAAALAQTIKSNLNDETSDFFQLAQHTEDLLLSFLDYHSDHRRAIHG
ncbi:dihydroxyacetone kinase transcriptional activator DhaS [Streptococcus ovuberis]|uniref:Dihydroxyacetone kinase transcriptional activator DhaS n=1 Tax=Streptococcus ovuberis TaxID=1936207 RepID=A0A7X6MYS5_9STRE|nr:dihydroxyacetone kinase transcriptional activator DhaS [Streptococcus ovuberis]NKZ20243.1 dihydroxyacetone kinase transcriptional activator DhaS [Streptococcus ovuberis]